MTILTERAKNFRSAIADFIEERRKSKENEKGYDSGRYNYTTWLSDAASRAKNLKVVTHPIKFTHSSIKGASSICYRPENWGGYHEVGTHTLKNGFQQDFAISDAKHLDVHSFLTGVVIEGKPILDWFRESDKDLLAALGEDSVISKSVMDGIRSVFRVETEFSTSFLAKQVFWLNGDDPAEDDQYHLLQPMFSSSLEDAVYSQVRASIDGMFRARGTKKQDPTFEDHHTYPNVVVRNLGGSNEQNVSPRNKSRKGDNHLLSSLPPHWHSDSRIKLLKIDSVLKGFQWFEDVNELLRSLIALLEPGQDSTYEIRKERKRLEQALVQQLALFGENICLSQEPGWTRSPDCRLPLCEKLWLDPERVLLSLRDSHESEDADFNAAYHWGDWPDEVAGRFANWLNAQLHKAGLTAVGAAEYRHWVRQTILDADWPVPLQRRAAGGDA